MAKITNLFNINRLGYPHAICLECEGAIFHVEVIEEKDVYYFGFHLDESEKRSEETPACR